MTETPATTETPNLVDRFGRTKRKLRISLTDRCNLRCSYCMPEDPEWLPKSQLLTFEELYRLVEICVRGYGVNQLRITGGEPLVRKGAVEFIDSLKALREVGLERISMTTNGTLLDRFAEPLREAGLDDMNISIDSLDPERVKTLTGGELEPVLRGIEATQAAGIHMKLNTVVIRGDNEDDVVPLTRWAYERDLPLRFIEFMPLDARDGWAPQRVVSEAEILEAVGREFDVEQIPRTREPATYYELNGRYRLGIISTVSNPFCSSCDRIRIAATGEIFPCLFSPMGIDLREPMRTGADDTEICRLLEQAVWRKGRGFEVSAGYVQRQVGMHAMGG